MILFFLLGITVSLCASTYGSELLATIHEVNVKATDAMLAEKTDRRERTKRQADAETGTTDSTPVNNCALECLHAMDKNLDDAIPEKNISSFRDHGKEVIQEYDEKEFETFCKTYQPGSQCLKQCPADDPIRKFAENGLRMVETMCVTKYEEFKRNLPCLNKIAEQVDKECDPQCKQYEGQFERLDKYGEEDDERELKPEELKELFKGSCLYVKCNMDCSAPTVEKACGKEASDLEKTTLVSAFSSVTDMLSTLNETISSFWPDECRALGQQ